MKTKILFVISVFSILLCLLSCDNNTELEDCYPLLSERYIKIPNLYSYEDGAEIVVSPNKDSIYSFRIEAKNTPWRIRHYTQDSWIQNPWIKCSVESGDSSAWITIYYSKNPSVTDDRLDILEIESELEEYRYKRTIYVYQQHREPFLYIRNVSVDKVTKNSITISFDYEADSPIESFTVNCYKNGVLEANVTESLSNESGHKTVTLSNLQPTTSYTVSINLSNQYKSETVNKQIMTTGKVPNQDDNETPKIQ